MKATQLATAWWPLTTKVRQGLIAYLGVESAAIVGELTTGTPGWTLIAAGAVPGAVGLITAYLTRDSTSPT